MNPPVEAPTSSARRPATSTPSASSAFASLIPPRDTYGGGAVDVELDVGGDELPRLVRPPPAGPEVHVARDHGRGRARARREQTALREQVIEPHARHAEQ